MKHKVTIEGETYKIKSHHRWAAFDGDSCLWSFVVAPAYDKDLNMWISDTEDDLVASSTRRLSFSSLTAATKVSLSVDSKEKNYD